MLNRSSYTNPEFVEHEKIWAGGLFRGHTRFPFAASSGWMGSRPSPNRVPRDLWGRCSSKPEMNFCYRSSFVRRAGR
jgi:hypothetical protein